MSIKVSQGVHFADQTLSGVPTLLNDFQGLVNDNETSDVLLIVGQDEVKFHAHKLVLWARCAAFRHYRAEFWGSNQPQSATLTFTYPEHDPDVFERVLNYVYTGKIILHDSVAMETLSLAQELGLPALMSNCQSHMRSMISSDNACMFLSSTLQQSESEDSAEDGEFARACIAYIESHAEACVVTSGWLELSKTTLVRLISSDQFSLPEEDVWRAVLGWAKYQTGIPLDSQPRAWSEHEKKVIREALEGVIQHVKVLLIDSAVFAAEVEPIGIVPMEVTLERYRYAAVPEHVSDYEDARLRPRVSHKLFQNTSILAQERLHFQRTLNAWYGNPRQQWQLIHDTAKDGFSAEMFHKNCDGIAPTFTIVEGANGCVCGGFSDVPWTSNTPPRGRYIASSRLISTEGVVPTKFSVISTKFATMHHPSFGPLFGAGNDLCLANNCDSGLESYSNLPNSYGGPRASNTILMGEYSFNVAKYEVFTPCH